jgi:hypothetical protein
MPDSTSAPAAVRPLRLGRLGALAVLVFLFGGVLYLLSVNGQDEPAEADALVPVREIRPFQTIEPEDLGVRRVPVEAGRSYLHRRDEVQGRYALLTLRPDSPITPAQLGPTAPAGLNTAFVFTIEGGAEVSLTGRLSAGDTVDLLAGNQGSRIERAFVLDVRALRPDRWAVTVCVTEALSPPQARLVTEDRAAVVRRPEP